MRYLQSLLLVVLLLPAHSLAADDPRQLFLTGKYAEAAEIFAVRAKEDPAAAVALARCLVAQGKRDRAAEVLEKARPTARVLAERARLALARGDRASAQKEADEALEKNPDALVARWIRAELLRTEGKLDEAEKAYRWFVRYYNGHDVEDAEALCWIARATAHYARWNRLHDQFGFLVKELFPDALRREPNFWPAHYEAGLLFLEKHNLADASRAFQAALAINPHAAEVHAVLARVALEGRDVDRAQTSLARALELKVELVDAWLLKADLTWANFQPAEAIELLKKKALALDPTREEALGRLAAGYVLLDGFSTEDTKSRFATTRDAVLGRNPHAGEFFLAMGAWLEARHKAALAERFLEEAIRRMPRLPGPRAALGLVYLHDAREDDARRTLKEAFEVDPFNVRVKNTLELLDVLAEMETSKTPQVIVRFDATGDQLLNRYARRHLDEIYPKLCKQFGYRPPEPPLIEIFHQAKGQSGQAWFSTRMTGLPYLGTVAACTGKVVGMTSPGDPALRKPYNWARVLTHELVHVVTLQQTDFNIPHWFTEGLAVRAEGYPRPESWNDLLRRRVPQGKTYTLQTINFGFTRPGSGHDWHMAYCQAELYVDFLAERFGEEAISKLLRAYAEGLPTPEAIRRATGVGQEEFEKQYLAYLHKVTESLSRLDRPRRRDLAEVLQAQRARPDDADLAAEAAYASLRRGARREALELALRAEQLNPQQPLAAYVRARLELLAGQTGEAVARLEANLDPKRPHALVLNLLAGLKLKAGDYDEAERLYRIGTEREPGNPQWLRALGRVYLLAENGSKLTETLACLAQMDAEDLTIRKKLARMALGRRDWAEAERWARAALEIDVSDPEVHRAFAEALVGRHNYAMAIEEFETAIELDPSESHQRFALADACLQAGQPEKARRVLEALLRMVPDYPGAEILLQGIEEDEQDGGNETSP